MLPFLQSFKLIPYTRNQAVPPEINMSFTGFQHSGMYSTTREVWCSPLGDTKLHDSHSLVHKLKCGNREQFTHTHTRTQFGDLTCFVLAYLQRKLNLGSRIQQLAA
jgi:hypothetical protein